MGASSRASRVTGAVAITALSAFAVGICLHYGHLGIHRLDQSIIFDGGWRIASGQLPFRDFTTPAGIVPSAMQALFFVAFGVTWFAYCLHAALVNALFAIVMLLVARLLGAGFWVAWLVGVASAVVFYPPFGVPYMDQHSFFFSACCLWTTLVCVGGRAGSRAALIATPSIAALALFSKLVPAALVVVPSLVVAIAIGLSKYPRWVAAGIALPAAGGLLYAVAIRANPHDLALFMITLPFRTATSRTVLYPSQTTGLFWLRLDHIWREWLDLLVMTRPLVLGLWLAAGAMWLGRVFSGRGNGWRPIGLLLLSMYLALVTAAFTYVTNNAASNGLAFLALIIATAWLAFAATLDRLDGRARGLWRTARMTLAVLVLAATVHDVWRFYRIVIVERALQKFDPSLPRRSPGGRLRFMILNDSPYLFDVREILSYIASRSENFLLFGDSAYVYGATGHPSVFPALWFHPGLTMPVPGSNEFKAFETRLIAHLSRYRARYVIQEGFETYMGARLDGFPQLTAMIAGCPERTLAGWTIREICHWSAGATSGRGVADERPVVASQ